MKFTNAIHRPGYFTLQLLHLSVIENILYKEVLCTGLFHLCIIMIMWNLGTESNKGCFMRNSDFVIEIWRRRKSRHCTWSLVYCFPFPFGAMKPNIAWHPLVSPQIRVGWQILKNSSRAVWCQKLLYYGACLRWWARNMPLPRLTMGVKIWPKVFLTNQCNKRPLQWIYM